MFTIIFFILVIQNSPISFGQTEQNTTDIWIIQKCCPIGYQLVGHGLRSECELSNITLLPEYWGAETSSNNTIIKVIVGDPCPFRKYRLEPEKESADEFHLLRNGSLSIPFQYEGYLGMSEYCVEVFNTSNGLTVLPLVCFPSDIETNVDQNNDYWDNIKMIVYPIGLLLSIPFLLVTLLVYLFISELRDTQGKTLCCHISCLIVAYGTLATVQLDVSSLPDNMCLILGFVIQFSFLACFFWLNVLCFDTWWRITSPHTYCKYKVENRRFFWYSLYAWTLPIFLLLWTVVMELSPIIPPLYLKPDIGYNCWFSNDKSVLYFFYGPMGFILITNLIFFILSARHIPVYKVHSEESEASLQIDNSTARKKALDMFCKCVQLFSVMGLNWIMEIISWALGGPALVWFVTDVINTLQGIIIFVIFVVRAPRVRKCINKKFNSSICNS